MIRHHIKLYIQRLDVSGIVGYDCYVDDLIHILHNRIQYIHKIEGNIIDLVAHEWSSTREVYFITLQSDDAGREAMLAEIAKLNLPIKEQVANVIFAKFS